MPALSRGAVRAALWSLIAIVVATQVYLGLTKGINWDEFFHFSQLHESARGQFINPVQTAHVWLFGWVIGLPGTSIDHILIIRILSLPFELVVLAVIYDISRRFAWTEAALLAVLAYAGGGYVMTQALALRTDTIAAALLMGALWIVAVRPARVIEAIIAALLLAVALVATIKSALYAPAFAGIAWLRWQQQSQRRNLLVCIAVIAAVLPLSFWMMVLLLQPDVATGQVGTAVGGTAKGAARHVFASGFLPRGEYLLAQTLAAPVLMAMLLAAPVMIFRLRGNPACRIALASMLIPVLSIAVYTNAYPYFYGFILAPAAIAIVPVADWAIKRWGAALPAFVLFFFTAAFALHQDLAAQERQRTVAAAIQQMFPQPVWHFSWDNLPGKYPRGTRFLLSGWGLKNYRLVGKPLLSDTMDRETVPFILLNSEALYNSFLPPISSDRLLPADEARVRESYIPHWGLVYVAGKTIPAGTASVPLSVHVPGIYTVEGGPLTIDGTLLQEGRTVELERGEHVVTGPRTVDTVIRWGDHLPRPAFPFPAGDLYSVY